MIIFAGYPFTVQIIVLPNPQLSNQEQVQDGRDYRISMDKTVHSYIKTTVKKLYIYNFLTTRQKAAEFEIFIQTYFNLQWRIQDHHNNLLDGHVVNNPIAIQYTGKFDLQNPTCPSDGLGYSGNERATFELEFEA